MTTLTCLTEEALLALLFDDDPSAEGREHLAICAQCAQRLATLRHEVETLRFSASSVGVGVPVAVAPDDRELTNIGRYLIVGSIAAGSQGRVYRGLHPTLGVEVAIKWSDAPVEADPARRDSLTAEGQLLAQLDHPHLVRVLDLDVQDDRPFLVMEYVAGGDLQDRTQGGCVRPEQAAAWVAQLARALATAHARGIIHQDIKPRNILVDESDRVRLSDFGLARLQQAGTDLAGEPLGGTLAFMAPEQARKEAANIGPASDIFGLGGVLFYLLTDKAPFEGDNPLLVRQRASQGDVDWTPLRIANVPKGLAAICRRALAARREDRYPSAEALAQDLERWLKRTNWTMRVALGAGALLIAAVVVWFLIPGPRPVATPAEKAPLPEDVQPLITQIQRKGGGFADIRGAITLRKGDEARIVCEVPRGSHVALLLMDAKGNVSQPHDFSLVPGDRFDRLTYPARKSLVETGEPGTELVLVCASHSPIDEAKIKAIIGEAWADIPDWAVLLVDRNRVQVVQGDRSLQVDPVGTNLTNAEDRLENIRLQLRDQCDYFAGVVYLVR